MKKFLLTALALVTVAVVSIVGTVAYLTWDDSDVNVMTVGNVQIEQIEQERDANGKLVDFTQSKPVLPAVYEGSSIPWAAEDEWPVSGDTAWKVVEDNENVVDKFVSVKNTGKSDAFVRTIIAFEAGKDKLGEPYMHLVHNDSADTWDFEWAVDENNEDITIEIDGSVYYIGVYTYTKVLEPGVTTVPNVKQVYLDKTATNEICAAYGDTFEILAISQAVQADGFDGPDAALVAGFGEVNAENATNWFGGIWEEHDKYLPIPADAVPVTTSEAFIDALATGGNYKIAASFEVTGIHSVTASTAFYNNDPANVVTFGQNARLKTAENVDLSLYGVEIDGGGSFTMTDGVFTTDATACNNDAILMAFAGSTLTLGKGTNIQNVVSNCPAVAWAKGTVDNRATIILDGVTIQNCAGGSGTVVNVDNYGDVYVEEGTVIADNVSYNQQNHGIFRIYNPWDATYPSTLTINGGEIRNNYFSANGMIGLYWSNMTMNGGKIYDNAWYSYNGKTNGFYCAVYVHSNSQFIMNGGEISGNTITDGVINAINSEIEGAITFNGGTVTNNSNTRNEGKDALAAVCYPNAMEKTLFISEKANVTGTVYNHAIEGDVVVRNYSEISEFFAQ